MDIKMQSDDTEVEHEVDHTAETVNFHRERSWSKCRSSRR